MLGRKDGTSSIACSKPPPWGEQGFTPTGTGSKYCHSHIRRGIA
jgi:hypothetical protein